MTVPDFVIAGAYRSGTTSLSRYLAQHPDIFLAPATEPSYFAFDGSGAYPKHLLRPDVDPFGRRRYTELSSYLSLFGGAKPGQVTGECSPEYLRQAGSATRLLAHNPELKVIITLRHPVERALSDWMMCRRDGAEDLELPAALAAIEHRAEADSFGAHYLDTSRYSRQLPEFLKVFPKSQLCIMTTEEWGADPTATLTKLCTFLGVDPAFGFSTDLVHNRSGIPKTAIVAKLFSIRRKLAPTLGQRTPMWLKARLDRVLNSGLDATISAADRAAVTRELAGEISRIEHLLGRQLVEWT